MSENSLAERAEYTRKWLSDPERMGELSKCLPAGMTPDAFMRIVMTTHLKNPKLHETTMASRWLAIMEAAQLGLPIDGRMGALGIFKGRAQFMPMYQGLIQLAHRHAKVIDVHAMPVFEGDIWDYQEGLKPRVRHEPARRQTVPKAEELIACYAYAKLKGGGTPFVWMWKYDLDTHREASKSYQRGEGPWITHPIPMYVKTAVIKLAKFIPQSTELVRALAHEDDPEHESAPGSPYVPSETGVSEILDAIAISGDEVEP